MGSYMDAKIKAVIFDMDGVLIDAKEWHYEALNRALEYHKLLPISKIEHLQKYDGLPTKEKLALYEETKNLSPDEHKEISNTKQRLTTQMINEKCVPYNLHQNTLQKLKNEGYKLVVCSNAIKASVQSMLEKANILPFIDFYLSNQDVAKPKPEPYIYLLAIEKLNLKPHNILICEDNINGIKAAQESGAHVLKIGTVQDTNYHNIKATLQKIESGLTKKLYESPVRTARLSDMQGGWFIGDFHPSILTSKDFEIAVKTYNLGDIEEYHFHKIGTEITVILEGRAEMAERTLVEGDIILLEPGQGTSFKALTKVKTLVVKTPSVIGDKYLLNNGTSSIIS